MDMGLLAVKGLTKYFGGAICRKGFGGDYDSGLEVSINGKWIWVCLLLKDLQSILVA